MFAKRKRYFYDAGPDPRPILGSSRWSAKPGLRGCDTRRDLPVICNNPLGRNAGSVWQIQRGQLRGAPRCDISPELARRMIASSCDDNSVVLDVFGGAGTTAMVALQLGHRAITIDINADYTREARGRLSERTIAICGEYRRSKRRSRERAHVFYGKPMASETRWWQRDRSHGREENS